MDEFMRKMAELADRLGPAAADAALGAARTEALSTLASGALALAVAALLAWGSSSCAGRWAAAEEEDGMVGWGVLAAILGLAALFVGIAGAWQVIDPWTWATLWHPEYWVAKKVLHL